MNILVTGGAGFIGSHTCIELLNNGYSVEVVDNLVNSSYEAIKRVETITQKKIKFHEIDLLEKPKIYSLFKNSKFDVVIHFAALKAVGESIKEPLSYYQNNISGTINLLQTMGKFGVKKLVFSSSATVYGIPEKVPITEDFPIQPINPYGQTKAIIEKILNDIYVSDNSWKFSILRYFNPVGAHPSGNIGEAPSGKPNNIMPYLSLVAIGKLPFLEIFGNDYPTPDGTGIRDYIHVMDLANGHIAAMRHMDIENLSVFNLGSGIGYSVFELINAFEKVTNIKIPYKIIGRRPGDAAVSYADPGLANRILGWKTKLDIEAMCRDSWRWQSTNPNGYRKGN